ncbi:hypothetical protein [Saliphagus sp. LR7]|uniref:hypothetical protein n=1 Tax=Saliphagus sp. LR7 TaxID=2282654 RepID=UPI000DF77279|nr:hypothetical protein [Saliphagus sp. LR7]
MHRRRFLAGVGPAILLPGCLGGVGAGSENGDDDGTDDANENDTADDFERVVSIADTGDLPDRAPIAFDLRVLEERVAADGAALLELETTNVGDCDRTVSPYYKGRSGTDGPAGIVLYSLEAADSPGEDYRPECIDDPEPTQEAIDFTTEEGVHHELDPGEAVTDEYVVADDPSVEGCVPSGEYRFESTHVFEEIEDFDWGFDLEIREG